MMHTTPQAAEGGEIISFSTEQKRWAKVNKNKLSLSKATFQHL